MEPGGHHETDQLGCGVGGTSGQAAGSAPPPALLKTSFGKLPIYFIENRGVFPEEVAYYVQGVDRTLFFTER